MYTYAEWVTESQKTTAELAIIFGYALLPFLISVVYGCTRCGDRKIAWYKDVLAMLIGTGAFAIVQKVVGQMLIDATGDAQLSPHWAIMGADLAGFLATAIALPLAYRVLYSGAAAPAAAAGH